MSLLLNEDSMVIQEQWDNFTQTDHHVWNILSEKQLELLKQRGVSEIIEGLEKLQICSKQIPKFSELNTLLQSYTGFSIVPVKGFIPDALFFKLLAQRRFPSGCFIRRPDQLEYLEEPDIFHDVFGHVPLLVNPVFADFMELFGRKGLEAIDAGMLQFASRLYWFTVEFGLIKTLEGLRIYGAGIASSNGESQYCLDSQVPARVKFNLLRILQTQYHIDSFQKTYFVIESFEQLFESLEGLDWNAVKEMCLAFPEIEQGIVLNHQEKVL